MKSKKVNLKKILPKIEDNIGKTFIKMPSYTNEEKIRAYQQIKQASYFLENLNNKFFNTLTKPTQSWLLKQEPAIINWIEDSLKGYEIIDQNLKIHFNNGEIKEIELRPGPVLFEEIFKPKKYIRGHFIQISLLMREENFLLAHLALAKDFFTKKDEVSNNGV